MNLYTNYPVSPDFSKVKRRPEPFFSSFSNLFTFFKILVVLICKCCTNFFLAQLYYKQCSF